MKPKVRPNTDATKEDSKEALDEEIVDALRGKESYPSVQSHFSNI
jgi:hypothetical protein